VTENSNDAAIQPLSVVDIKSMKQRGEKISCLTAYDASFSAVLDKAGVDMILVGDSLGMVVQGHASTVPVTMDDMVYHVHCVTRVSRRALVIADLPFMSYASLEAAAQNAARLMQAGGAQMVKLEGAKLEVIRFLIEQGVPVCGHLGLLPQSIYQLGRYQVQGKAEAEAAMILKQAQQLEAAGVTLLVLECVPAELARKITETIQIPVIGIGAGADCDGQVLVLYDMLNISLGKRPRFSKNFLQDADSIESAVRCYVQEVKQSRFPAQEHCY
jgi:3-methyl-2-oxobutanoate hydroxymethyltransferase